MVIVLANPGNWDIRVRAIDVLLKLTWHLYEKVKQVTTSQVIFIDDAYHCIETMLFLTIYVKSWFEISFMPLKRYSFVIMYATLLWASYRFAKIC